jgi:hypothetical protein
VDDAVPIALIEAAIGMFGFFVAASAGIFRFGRIRRQIPVFEVVDINPVRKDKGLFMFFQG